jgi:hypothetical protein
MADLMAVSPDRKNIVFRNFIDDAMWLNLISDDAPEKVQTIKYCSPGEFASGEYSIFPLSGIAFVRDEIFVNGYEHDLLTAASRPDVAGKPQLTRTGNREFTATSLQKKPGDATPGIWAAITIWEVKGIHFTKACCKPSQTCLHW